MARKLIGMAGKVAGPRGSSRRRWVALLSLVIMVGASLFFVQTVLAVHDTGVFQLDGDAATGTNTAGTPAGSDDWDKVCYQVAVTPVNQGGLGLTPAQATAKCSIGSPTTGATAVSWVEEPNPASSIFTGGGSKDPQDITEWLWKDEANNPPDKDNLVHAYAVRYSLAPSANCPNGLDPSDPDYATTKCEVLFFGSDRFDNSGDANSGFWFLQSQVGLTQNKSQGGLEFSGQHEDGDLLIISGFSNGGTTSTISVYTWDPACLGDGKPDASCKADNLRLQANLEGPPAHCLTAAIPGDLGCGIVNPQLITMPWTFTDKSGTAANGALNGEFFEAGINLSLLGLADECFATVVSETRSSTSPTSTLKDFVLGPFAVCAPNLTTDVENVVANGTVSPGTQVRDLARIEITGATNPDDATGTVDFFYCYNATQIPDCSTGGTAAGADKALVDISNPLDPEDGVSGAFSDFINTAGSPLLPGFYCFRAEATLANYSSPAPHTDTTTECFRVRDTSTATTAQRWLPNDQVTVLLSGGGAASGSVTFSLFENGNCTAPAAATFGPINLDGNGQALTNNLSYYTSSQTISWRVVFISSNANVDGDTSNCEISSVTINNAGIP